MIHIISLFLKTMTTVLSFANPSCPKCVHLRQLWNNHKQPFASCHFGVFRVSHVCENKTNKNECGGWEQRSCHSWKPDFVFWASVCPEEVIAGFLA